MAWFQARIKLQLIIIVCSLLCFVSHAKSSSSSSSGDRIDPLVIFHQMVMSLPLTRWDSVTLGRYYNSTSSTMSSMPDVRISVTFPGDFQEPSLFITPKIPQPPNKPMLGEWWKIFPLVALVWFIVR
ncbi:hypothetical protein BS78_K222700 [Paspalum vaginatum]|uniref:Uncharacterized protein n=1 Tax=Paspalum vaginatum TaxID=158149 RepID=A0A9W7XDS8_9POAL|nr:hypothetical protein BS78_K222700 [Paspalum vaginatum]